jgi:hypothetical protein
MMWPPSFLRTSSAAVALLVAVGLTRAADFDRDPIRYETAPDDNVVSRLGRGLESGKIKLAHHDKAGYLKALLKELNVPESSQVLVFSKTSFQHRRIGPMTPRAIYFNDDVYVGYCLKSETLELSAADPQLGTVFYTLTGKKGETPKLARQGDNCLICHGSSRNEGLPGHLVRSVYPDSEGFGILSAGSFRIDHTTPLKQRWGGWYVTGTSGKQTHLGNLTISDKARAEEIDNTAGTNVTDLSDRFRTSAYLTPHSDIVALMVMEHQTAVQNKITRADFFTRVALYDEASLNKALGRPANHRSESTVRRIEDAAEPLVKALLLTEEAPLTGRIKGTSGFAEEYVRQGPRDGQKRSLRDLDLEHRLFKYPCSPVIYSPTLDALPEVVKERVYRRLHDVLSGKDTSKEFAHLTAADRKAILEILRETKRNLPAYFKTAR